MNRETAIQIRDTKLTLIRLADSIRAHLKWEGDSTVKQLAVAHQTDIETITAGLKFLVKQRRAVRIGRHYRGR